MRKHKKTNGTTGWETGEKKILLAQSDIVCFIQIIHQRKLVHSNTWKICDSSDVYQ